QFAFAPPRQPSIPSVRREPGESEDQETDDKGHIARRRRAAEQSRDHAEQADGKNQRRRKPVAHHATNSQTEEDRDHIENAHQREVHETLIRTFVGLIVVSGGGGVFNSAVVGHGESSPSRAKSGRRSGVSAIAAQGQRRRDQPLDGCKPTLASAAASRLATSSTEKRSIDSLNKR